MGEGSVTSHDLALLRDILGLTRAPAVRGAANATFETLDLMERVTHSDCVSFQVMHVQRGADLTRLYAQGVEHGFHDVLMADELQSLDGAQRGNALEQHWWQLPCSQVDRTGVACVTSLVSHFGERAWGAHPVHLDYLPYADEILLAYPLPGGRSLRILAARESARPFGLRELTIMELLLPHLRPSLTATFEEQTAAGSATRHPEALSPRQVEILHMVALGMPNKQVGTRLGIAEGTVRKHLENVYARLGVQSRTEAILQLQAVEGAGG